MAVITPDQINPLDLPSLPLELRKDLPNCHSVYFVMEGDEIVYVGRTKRLAFRWQAHHKLPLLKDKHDVKICWLEVGEEIDAEELEEYFIRKYQPKLNGKLMGNNPEMKLKQPKSEDVVFVPLSVVAAVMWTPDNGRQLKELRSKLAIQNLFTIFEEELIRLLEGCQETTTITPTMLLSLCKALSVNVADLIYCMTIIIPGQSRERYNV